MIQSSFQFNAYILDMSIDRGYPGGTANETYESYVCKVLGKGFVGDIVFKYYFEMRYEFNRIEAAGQLWKKEDDQFVKNGWFGLQCK